MHRIAPFLLLAACTADVSIIRTATPDNELVARDVPAASAPLGDTLQWLSEEVAGRSPGTELAISVVDLQSGESFGIAGDALHVSASSAKAYWVAAALDGTSVAAVSPYAGPIFASSDNYASAAVIDLIGPSAVNTYLWNAVGMSSTALTQWSYGRSRVAANSPRLMGSDNYTTSDDAATFMKDLAWRAILADDRGDALAMWLTWSPRTGVGGWLPARLPAAAKAAAMHKAGWLPPGCCDDDRAYNTLNDIGIVTAPDGRAYSVAILAKGGFDYWGKQAPFVELASCSLYRAFTQDEGLDCSRASDPMPAQSCGDVTYTGYCDGSAVVWCENDALHRVDCTSKGETCGFQDDTVGYNCM